MVIGDRLRELREMTKRSQGDIEKRTGCSAAIFPESRTATRF
jgi:transcriptional regulator with XRE-family HTH domain